MSKEMYHKDDIEKIGWDIIAIPIGCEIVQHDYWELDTETHHLKSADGLVDIALIGDGIPIDEALKTYGKMICLVLVLGDKAFLVPTEFQRFDPEARTWKTEEF